ncbi:MAG: hypothetical protein M1326_08000 [Cyanobacteria bacterium]|nr:hypothetical protein [Cyanobacteriota bacterium]
MTKILLSVPDEMLEKIDRYKDRKKIKRNQFLINAVENYFQTLWEEDYFERKKIAFERIQKIRQKIGIKDWDPVAEIRNIRESAEKEVLKKLS